MAFSPARPPYSLQALTASVPMCPVQQAEAAALGVVDGDVQDAPDQHPNGILPSTPALPPAALPAAQPQPAPGTAQQPADPFQPSGSGQPFLRGSFMDLLVAEDEEEGAVGGGEGQAAVAAAVGRGSRTLDPTPPCSEGGGLFSAAAGMAQGIVLDVPHATWSTLASQVQQQQLPESQPATPAKASQRHNPFGRTSSSSSLDTECQAYSGGSVGGGNSSSGGSAYGMMLLQGQPPRRVSLSPCPATPAQHVAFSPATTCPPASYSLQAVPTPYGQPSGLHLPATVQHPAAAAPPTTPTHSSTHRPSSRSSGGASYCRYIPYPDPYPGYPAYHSPWGGPSGHGPAAAPAPSSYTQGGALAAASPAGYACGPGSQGGASSDYRIPSVPGSPYPPYSPMHSDVPSPAPAYHAAHAAHHSRGLHALPPRPPLPGRPPMPYGPDRSHGARRALQFTYAGAAPAMPPYCAPLPYGGGAPGGAPCPARAAAELPGASPPPNGYGYGYQQQYHYQQQQAAWQYYQPPPPPPPPPQQQQQPQWPGSAAYRPAAQAPHPALASSSRALDVYGTAAAAAATGPTAAQHVCARPVASLPPSTTRPQLDVPNAAAPWKGASAAAGTGREAGPGFTFPEVTDTQRPGTPTLLPLQPLPQPQTRVGVLKALLGQPAAAPPAADLEGLGALGLQSDGGDTFSLLRDIDSSAAPALPTEDHPDLPSEDDELDSLLLHPLLSDNGSGYDDVGSLMSFLNPSADELALLGR